MHPFSTPQARWTAVTSRNPAAAESFIYSVRSTKIYCRPTCPARLARRANVLFHDTAAAAEGAGYRACLRCRPGSAEGREGDAQQVAVAKACTLVGGEGEGKKNSVRDLAREVGWTESHFCRVFKKIVGGTVGEYRARLRERRLEGTEDVLSQAGGATPSPYVAYPPVDDLGIQDSFVDLDMDFAQEWFDLGGMPISCTDLALISGTGTEVQPQFYVSLDTISDASMPSTMNNGFQFVEFGVTDFELENGPSRPPTSQALKGNLPYSGTVGVK